jgi:thymidylate kinase
VNPIKHRLIMFYGVSPGAGKTTLSDWLRLELTKRGASVVWIEEHHVHDLEMFSEVVKVFTHGADDYETPLLKTAEMLVQQYLDKDDVVLTDALFPSYTWLFASGIPKTTISEFNQKLAEVLKPLNPLIIWLDGDVPALLERAVEQRGDDWLKGLIESINSYTYAPVRPVVDVVGVESFFKELKVLHFDMLTEWPHDVLKLNATETPLEILQTNIKWQFEKSGMS